VGSERHRPPIDAPLYHRDDVRRILAERDIAALYRVLKDAGVTQRQIAALTGQSQSEVSEILKGRHVRAYDVLVRIAEGLGIPREFMGLSYGDSATYAEEVTVSDPPEDEDVLRRAVLLAAPVAVWGLPLFGEIPELPAPPWVPSPLPSRLGMTDVVRVEHQTGLLRTLAYQHGGHADAAHAIATHAMRLMAVPAEDRVKAKLGSALARLHTLAGWCCADSLLDAHACHHFRQALELASESYEMVITLRVAGNTDRLRGHPNDALKLYQLALVKAWDLPRDDPQTAVLTSWLHAQSARAFAAMGIEDKAWSSLAEARDGWYPPGDLARADFDSQTAQVHLDFGRLDIAEPFAAAAVQASDNQRHVAGALALTTLAAIHVRAGEPDGIPLARKAIDRITVLSSPRSRQQLQPLTAALEARPGGDARELARMARQVATTRGVNSAGGCPLR
jgi:transcriptional regulator with XRE-family HTH domain